MLLLKQTVKPLCIALASAALMQCSTMDEAALFKEKVNESLSHYYRGLELRVKKDFAGAEAEMMQSLEISPRPRTYLALAELALVQEKPDEAEGYIDRALRLSPNLSLGKELKQQIQVRKNAGAAATQTSNMNADDLPSRTLPLQQSNSSITQTQPVQETVMKPQPIEPAPIIQPETTPPELQNAKNAANRSDWGEASRLATQIIAGHPENSEAFYLLGYIHFQQKNYEEAEQVFRQTIRLEPNHANALNDLGITLEYVGRSAEAIEYYERSVNTGTNPDAFFNLALLEEKRGQYAKAISLYERYLQRDQTSAFSDFAKERIGKLRRVEY